MPSPKRKPQSEDHVSEVKESEAPIELSDLAVTPAEGTEAIVEVIPPAAPPEAVATEFRVVTY